MAATAVDGDVNDPLAPYAINDFDFSAQALPNPVTLDDIKSNPKLKDMLLIRKGMRLSIQPVTKEEFDEVVSMGGA